MRQLLILVFALTGVAVRAQFTQYSLYRFAEPRVNPANLGLTNYASFGALYRSQQSQPGVMFNAAYIQASYPFLRRKGTWSAIGIDAANDREGTGGIFQTNEIGVQYGFHIPLSKTQRLALGASVNFFSRRINISELFTGSQFLSGIGFDPGADQGEAFSDFNTNYFTGGIGFKWQVVDKRKVTKTTFGMSAFNLNRPTEDFISNDDPLPVNLVVEAGQQLLARKYARFYLEALLWQVQNNTSLNAGLVTMIDLRKFDGRLRGQTLNVHVRYLLHEGAMIGWQWDNAFFSLGMSYDLPLVDNAGHDGAFEIGVKLRRPVQAKSKKRKKKKTGTSRRFTRPPRRTNPDDDELTIAVRPEPEEPEAITDSSTLVVVADSIPEAEDILVIHFGFEFGDTEPVIEDEYIFDQVLERMNNDRELRIEIVGHTDDVGPSRFNQRLSELRAEAIFDILFELGADSDRMSTLGRGEDDPLVPNDTDENRSENRRVEIVFIHPE